MKHALEIPAGGPMFEGHFPGHPILPGVTLLVLASREAGCEARGGIGHARFRHTVRPGDRLEIDSREETGGRVRLGITRGTEKIATAELSSRPPQPLDVTGSMVASRRVAGAPPIESLLPHRAPMRFIQRIVGEADDGMTCEAEIPVACALVERGGVSAIVAVEAAAQTAGVWEALRRIRAGDATGPRIGYLVGLSEIRFHVDRIAAGEPFFASVRLLDSASALAHYSIEASIDAMPIVRGTIATFLA